jgi:hypothetical protein
MSTAFSGNSGSRNKSSGSLKEEERRNSKPSNLSAFYHDAVSTT